MTAQLARPRFEPLRFVKPDISQVVRVFERPVDGTPGQIPARVVVVFAKSCLREFEAFHSAFCVRRQSPRGCRSEEGVNL